MKVVLDSESNSVYAIVKWQHKRQEDQIKIGGRTKELCGITRCEVRMDHGTLYGEAWCLKSDNYDKNKGRKESLTRAIKPLDRKIRKHFWMAYDEETGKLCKK